jgi:mannose-6-phosphate isomerase-like protein (cupin superfamily)
MRRVHVLLSIVAIALLGMLALHAQPVAVAQEATPAADMDMEGVTFEPVTFANGIDLMSPADLFIARVGLDPGAGFPIEETDPTLGFLLVESGTFTVQSEGTMTVTRGAGMTQAMATAEATGDFSTLMETIMAGEAVTLEAGDATYIPANAAGEVRNEGQERAVGLAFLVMPPEGMMGEATPAP